MDRGCFPGRQSHQSSPLRPLPLACPGPWAGCVLLEAAAVTCQAQPSLESGKDLGLQKFQALTREELSGHFSYEGPEVQAFCVARSPSTLI